MNTKRLIMAVIGLLVISAAIYFVIGTNSQPTQAQETKTATKKKEKRKILYWRAPMDPTETYDHPGKSKMGMDLVPVYADQSGAEGVITIDPVVQQDMNLQTDFVKEKALSPIVNTNGVVTTNEKNEFIVTTKVSGWIQKLYVNYTGQKISKGQKLMDIYSPELVSAEQEYLTALSYKNSTSQSKIADVSKSGDELVKNSIRKLELLDMSPADITQIENTKDVKTYVTLYAPHSGTVLHKNIEEGQKIKAGMPLLKIADLSNLWLSADIYEYELAKIKVGDNAKIKFNYLPGKTFDGKISFIYPTIDPKSRTVKVRFNLNNRTGQLKPEMFANVVIDGQRLKSTPVVPENAVIRSGTKDIVIVALGNGKFKPQAVTLGLYSDGYYQVLNGLSEGTKIVTSAQFLIDSESNLRAAISHMREGDNGKSDSTSSNSKMNMKMDMKKDDSSKKINMKNDSKKMNMDKNGSSTEMNMKTDKKSSETSIVRKGVIDLASIDKNKDGKVFEDIMDWNVISDKPGKCPLCGMTLREFTLAKAKGNLKEHGFQVK